MADQDDELFEDTLRESGVGYAVRRWLPGERAAIRKRFGITDPQEMATEIGHIVDEHLT